MAFVESNTTTLGLGISSDSDGYSTSSSTSSSLASVEGIFSDVQLSSSASDLDESSPTLAGSSDEDNFIIFSDDEFNIYFVDRRELADEQIQVADFLPWPTGNPPSQLSRSVSRDSYESDAADVTEGYESDADDLLDDLLWRRGRAKRHRANPSRAQYLIDPYEPVFEMVVPVTRAERAALAPPTASQDPGPPPTRAVDPVVVEDPTRHSVDERLCDMYGSQEYVSEETGASQFMGQIDLPSDEYEYEELYSSDGEHPHPKRIRYTSETREITSIYLPAITEEQAAELRRGYALGLPMEDIMPTVLPATHNEHSEVEIAEMPLGDAHSSDEVQSNGTSSDSMETIDLNTSSDDERTLVEVVGPDVSASAPSMLTSRVQLGPFCVAEGPFLPLDPAPAIPTRSRSLEFFTLGRGHLSL
ncbi:hypothetical protein L226DRAFT_612769 [Lentinus tigrinus ALCF2SS1-7]|nr:hypothetical protein L226DRAFT_612769 [Lentinus tigrinus ALCF2SS1-7]